MAESRGARGVDSMSAVGRREIGVEKEEEDHTESHEIHVDTEDYAGVVEVPTALNATNGVDRAQAGEQCGKKDEEVGAAVGEAR